MGINVSNTPVYQGLYEPVSESSGTGEFDPSSISVVGGGVFPDLASFNAAGGAAAYGEGPFWIGGVQYWSNGVNISAAGNHISSKPSFIQIGDSILGAGNFILIDSTVTCSSGVCTVVSAAAHGLANGFEICAFNRAVDSLNGRKTVTVINSTTYSYPCDPTISGSVSAKGSGVFFTQPLQRCNDGNIVKLAVGLMGGNLQDLGNFACSSDWISHCIDKVQYWDSLSPNYVFCHIGTNDILGQSPFDTIKSDYMALVSEVNKTGAQLVLFTPVPKSDTGAVRVLMNQTVNWLRSTFANYPGVLLIDSHALLVDVASAAGAFKTGYSVDGTHPTKVARMVLAKHIKTVLQNRLPVAPAITRSLADTFGTVSSSKQLNDNPGFLGTAGTLGAGVTGTVADGYTLNKSASATVAASIETAADGTRKQVIDLTTTAATTGFTLIRTASIHGRVTVGDSVKMSVRVEGTNIPSDMLRYLTVGLSMTINGVAAFVFATGNGGASTESWSDTFDCVFETLPFVFTEQPTALNIIVEAYNRAIGSIQMKVSNCVIEKA